MCIVFKANKHERAKSSPTYKDLDFLELLPEGLMLEAETYNALITTMRRDCRVLESFRIMDYSLLIGIHNLDQAAREQVVRTRKSLKKNCIFWRMHTLLLLIIDRHELSMHLFICRRASAVWVLQKSKPVVKPSGRCNDTLTSKSWSTIPLRWNRFRHKPSPLTSRIICRKPAHKSSTWKIWPLWFLNSIFALQAWRDSSQKSKRRTAVALSGHHWHSTELPHAQKAWTCIQSNHSRWRKFLFLGMKFWWLVKRKFFYISGHGVGTSSRFLLPPVLSFHGRHGFQENPVT